MRAMLLPGPGSPFRLEGRADPKPGDGEIRVKVKACRTDLHIVVLTRLRDGQILGAAVLRP